MSYEGRDVLRISVVPPKGAEMESAFYTMETFKKELPNVVIRGYTSISRSVISGSGTDLSMNFEGMGLKDILGVPGLNGLETRSNHTLETASVLGIEAARLIIVEEINSLMASHGMTIDRRHLMLMADLQTFKVYILCQFS
jgi:DNA-directed RNA polymerase III subunit RPC1